MHEKNHIDEYLTLNIGRSDGALIEMQIHAAIRCNRRNDMAGSSVGTRIQGVLRSQLHVWWSTRCYNAMIRGIWGEGKGGKCGEQGRLSTAWPVWISASNNRPAFAPGLSDKGKDISRCMRVVDSINLNSIHGETEFNFCRVLFRVVYFVERSIRNNGVKNRRD